MLPLRLHARILSGTHPNTMGVGKVLELPAKRRELRKLRKIDERKVLLAAVLRRRPAVGVNWFAKRRAMGHPGSARRMLGARLRDKNLKMRLRELEKS